MLDRIRQAVAQIIALTDSRGIFLSAFDKTGALLISSGVLTTDKTMEQVIDMLYHGLIESHTTTDHIVVDIIDTLTTITSPDLLTHIDIQTQGIAVATIDHSKSGVMLPATMGVHNAFDALSLLKQKHNIEGNIVLYTFTTKRLSVK